MFGKKKNQDESGLEPGSDAMSVPRLSSLDIQQKEFRLAFRGYREKDVDLFLDQLTEEFTRLSEENKRVRGGAGIPVVAADNSAADDIRLRAQEEAAAILADARARAASIEAQAGGGGGGVAPVAAPNTAGVQAFLTEEREFLHGMAGMIQKHAETIRTTAKSVQQEVAAATAAAAAASPAGAHELSQAEADAVAVFSAPSSDEAPAADEASEPVEEAMVEEAVVEDAAIETPAVESAWAATASSAPATAEPEAAAPADVVSIPPSVVDSPADVAAEPVMAEEAPQDKRSLRELFWGED